MEIQEQPQIYLFGWPSCVGGADTKLAHLLDLLRDDCKLTVVPNETRSLKDLHWIRFLEERAIRYIPRDQLAPTMDGFALSLGNPCFFTDHIAHDAKRRGLFVIWSSEMICITIRRYGTNLRSRLRVAPWSCVTANLT